MNGAKFKASLSLKLSGGEFKLQNMGLSDLDVLATLGVGGFGRVELVRASTTGEKRTFALKCLKKQVWVSTFYKVVPLNFTPEIEVFYMLFEISLSIFSMPSLKHHL